MAVSNLIKKFGGSSSQLRKPSIVTSLPNTTLNLTKSYTQNNTPNNDNVSSPSPSPSPTFLQNLKSKSNNDPSNDNSVTSNNSVLRVKKFENLQIGEECEPEYVQNSFRTWHKVVNGKILPVKIIGTPGYKKKRKSITYKNGKKTFICKRARGRKTRKN